MAYLGHKPAVGENNSFRILDDISSFVLTFDGSSASVVGLSDETITITENNHRFITGQRVTYSNGGGGNITGLTNGQAYFVINHSKTQIKLASSASNALAGTAVNLTGLGTGSSHTLTLAFDGVNTKFVPTFGDGMHDTLIKRAAQLVISLNGVIQQPHDTATPSTGFGVDALGNLIFSTAPASTDIFWAHVLATNTITFDSSDNDVDTFTGNGSTTSFTLSKTPPDNRNILVTIDGVVQYPSDAANTRSYNLSENVMTFVAAPGLGTVIQVRHIGYAGPAAGGGGGVTGFYGRTGNVSLVSTDNIVANNATFNGNVSIAQTLTYEDVTDIDSVGLITARSGIKDQTLTAGHVVFAGTAGRLSGEANLFYDSSNDRLGIGSEIPQSKLELDGRFRILDNSDGTPSSGKGLEISYYTSDDKADILSYDRGASAYKDLMIRGNSIDLRRNNTSLLLVGTGGGNGTVGFSTTNVLVTNGEKIAVRGYSSFKSYNSSYAAIYVSSEGNTNDTINNLINFNAGGANRGGIGYMPNTGELRFNNQYFMTFCTGAAILGGTERLRITSAGRVGIGSDTPVAHLDVASSQNIETLRLRDRHFNKYLTIRGGGSPNRMIIDSYEGGGGGADIDLASNGDTKFRIGAGGTATFYSPAVAWHEGVAVLEASNGYGAIFFRSTGSTHGTSTTGTWSVGKLNGANGFGILKNGMTGGGAVRADAAINISDAGDTKIGKYLAIGHNNPVTRLDVKQNNGVAYNNRAQSVAYGAARFFNESGHASGGTYTGFQFNLTGDSQNRICSIGMISEASNNRTSSLVFATDDGGNRTEKLRITSAGNVGINSITPRGKLDIKFAGAPNYITFGSDADNPKMEWFRSTGGSPSHYATEIQMVLGDLVLSTAATANLGSHSYSEKLRINSGGRVLIGHSQASGDLHGPQGTTGRNPFIQLHGANTSDAGLGLISWKNSAGAYYAPTLYLAHSGSDTKGTNGILPSNGEFGSIIFSGDDGTDFVKGAMIKARLDGTPGNDNMPGRLAFYTNSGSDSPTERLRIDNQGNIKTGTVTSALNFTDSNSGNTKSLEVGATNGGDALLVTHSSGYGVAYFGYEAAADRLVIACDGGGGANKIDFITDAGTSTGGGSDNLNGKVAKMRLTQNGCLNLGGASQTTHQLYIQSTGDASIHLAADTDNSGENDNPSISMSQDGGGGAQHFKIGMAGDANTAFNMQIGNSPFVHANNANSQPLQLAHMTDMVATLSSVSTLASTGQSATDPRDFFSDGSLVSNAVGGLKIQHYGNDTAAALMLCGHNNTGTPGQETGTQLTHTGANLRFHIEHHGVEAFNITPQGNIYLKNCTTIPSFTTSYNVSALSLRGGSLMNFQESNIYVTQNLHYDGAWKNTYSGAGSMISQGGGTGRYYYFDDPGSAGQSVTLVNSIDFKNQSSASGMSYGNRPSYQGQLVLWGPSHATQKGGLEFHTSGGGGAGYGGRITCSDQGHIRFLTRHNNSGWGQRLIINASSGVVSGDLNDTSDIALKKNIVGISTSCIDNIKKLNPVTFEWKTDDGGALIDGVKNMGFVAQEVEKIIPEVVKGEDGQKAINVTGIVAQLTKALQESITKIETLEAKVAALEGS